MSGKNAPDLNYKNIKLLKRYLSESGRCGDFKGDDSDIEISTAPMPEIILELQKDEYLPGEHVRISGQIKNAIFNDSVELTIESPNTSDDGNEVNVITKSINLRGTEPTFYWKYDIASGVDGIGTDCANVCGGSNLEDTCGVCDADSSNDNTPDTGTCDCASVPSGSSYEDACGTCDDNTANDCVVLSLSSTETDEVVVSYNSPYAIAAYEFNYAGVSLSGASSSLDNNHDDNQVLGYSFTGDTLPAGNGTLATLSFTESSAGFNISIFDLATLE